MTLRNVLRTLVAACTLAATHASATPALLINSSGILTGANNVNVGGVLYDVMFAEGSCDSLFNGCMPSSFTFTTRASALAAAQALHDQVMVDSPLGLFDSTTDKIFGCSSSTFCFTLIPAERVTFEYFAGAEIRNNPAPTKDEVFTTTNTVSSDIDSSFIPQTNYAIFTLVGPPAGSVPEPGSIALTGMAIAGLAFARRKAKNSVFGA